MSHQINSLANSSVNSLVKPQTKQQSELLGAHFSIAGGLENAILTAEKFGCNVVQLFTKNARTWKEKMLGKAAIQAFIQERKHAGIKYVLSHASYLINIASNDKEKLKQSIHALECEMIRCSELEIDYLVLHPGAYLTAGEQKGVEQAAQSLKILFSSLPKTRTRLLIETTSGQGTCLGHRFEQIADILNKVDAHHRTGVCLDTCHIFAAGYDIRTTTPYNQVINNFHRIIGLDRLLAIHVNDSKTPLGSKKDRHEHIGAGCIGLKGFELIMNDKRLKQIPKILETAKEQNGLQMDPINLNTLFAMVN